MSSVTANPKRIRARQIKSADEPLSADELKNGGIKGPNRPDTAYRIVPEDNIINSFTKGKNPSFHQLFILKINMQRTGY